MRWLADTVPLPDDQVIEVLTDFRNVSVAVLVSSVATAGAQTLAALAGYLVAGVPQVLFFTALVGGLGAFGPVGLVAGPLVLSFFLAVVRLSRRPPSAGPDPLPDEIPA